MLFRGIERRGGGVEVSAWKAVENPNPERQEAKRKTVAGFWPGRGVEPIEDESIALLVRLDRNGAPRPGKMSNVHVGDPSSVTAARGLHPMKDVRPRVGVSCRREYQGFETRGQDESLIEKWLSLALELGPA